MAYCMYLRKSRADVEAEDRGEGETLARHERTLMDLAVRTGINISPDAIYREIVSGETIAARPVMQKLLSEIEQGIWQGVLVMEIERLARGATIDQGIIAQAFKYSDTKIVTPMKIYDPANEFDESFFEFGLFMSRQEYKAINRRLQRGREMSAREGKWTGNVAPYGYQRQKLEREKGWTLVPEPDEARVVALVYQWFTGPEHLGVTRIGRRLNSMQVPVRKGDAWTDMTVRSLLTNPVYAGLIRWGGRKSSKRIVDGKVVVSRPRAKDAPLFPGRHEPLVERLTFDAAQDLLAANAHSPVPGGRRMQNPLAGIVRCGSCGRLLVRRPYGGRDTPETLMCVGPDCQTVSSYLDLVEERLTEALESWLLKHRVEHWGNTDPDRETEVQLLRESIGRADVEIATLGKQFGSLRDLLEQGVYSVEVYMERSQSLKERLEDATARKADLVRRLGAEAAEPDEKRNFIPRVERAVDLYRTLVDPAEKNALLREVIERAVYRKPPENRGKLDAFELDIYPRLPR